MRVPRVGRASKGNLSATDLSSLSVEEVMTLLPDTVEEDSSLSLAGKLMQERKFRHLPVVRRGKLTGILSDRDLHIATLLPHIEKISVGDVMTANPLTIPGDAAVLSAVSAMVEEKISCLVVTGVSDDVLGIFTSQDAMKLMLGERKHHLPAPSGYPLLDSEDDEDEGSEK